MSSWFPLFPYYELCLQQLVPPAQVSMAYCHHKLLACPLNIDRSTLLSHSLPAACRGLGALNSLAPGRFEWNFMLMIFKLISVIGGWGISCEIALRWMPLALTDDKSTLVQVMAWCHQAPSHYLSQCGARSLSPYGVTRPQWVNIWVLEWNGSLVQTTY